MNLLEGNAMLAIIGMPGWAEILVVAFVGLLLFGKRLPEVARSVGKSVVEFKKGMRDVRDEIDSSGSGNTNRSMDSRSQPPLPPPPQPASHESPHNGVAD